MWASKKPQYSHNLNGKWICSTNALSVQSIFFVMFFLRFSFCYGFQTLIYPEEICFSVLICKMFYFSSDQKNTFRQTNINYEIWIHCTIEFWIWTSWMNVLAECVFEFWHFPKIDEGNPLYTMISALRYFAHTWSVVQWMTGWWFGTWLLFFHILGMSSSQLTNSIIFQRGRLNHQPDDVATCCNMLQLVISRWKCEATARMHVLGCYADSVAWDEDLFV